jgi:hypothetical protein
MRRRLRGTKGFMQTQRFRKGRQKTGRLPVKKRDPENGIAEIRTL